MSDSQAKPYKATVLAIDDQPQNLKLLGQILASDHRFLLATSGSDGLDIAINQRPDLILLDVGDSGVAAQRL